MLVFFLMKSKISVTVERFDIAVSAAKRVSGNYILDMGSSHYSHTGFTKVKRNPPFSANLLVETLH